MLFDIFSKTAKDKYIMFPSINLLPDGIGTSCYYVCCLSEFAMHVMRVPNEVIRELYRLGRSHSSRRRAALVLDWCK